MAQLIFHLPRCLSAVREDDDRQSDCTGRDGHDPKCKATADSRYYVCSTASNTTRMFMQLENRGEALQSTGYVECLGESCSAALLSVGMSRQWLNFEFWVDLPFKFLQLQSWLCNDSRSLNPRVCFWLYIGRLRTEKSKIGSNFFILFMVRTAVLEKKSVEVELFFANAKENHQIQKQAYIN